MTTRIPEANYFKFVVKPLWLTDDAPQGVTVRIDNAWNMAERLSYFSDVPYCIMDENNNTVGLCDIF